MWLKCRPCRAACLKARHHEEALANVKEAIVGWLETMEGKAELDLNQSVEVMV